MSKKRKIIYICSFVFLIISIIFCLFKLKSSPTITPPAVPTPSNIVQEISWEKAVELIKNCQIKVIFQARTLQINMRGHDNQLYYTVEPKFNDVINVAQEVQGPCDIIQTVTE